jgi:hypothetical protein
MTTYPHRYGDTDRARQHYATACVASARILRSEGQPGQAADLEDAARRAHANPAPQRDTDQPTNAQPGDDELAPEWWR